MASYNVVNFHHVYQGYSKILTEFQKIHRQCILAPVTKKELAKFKERIKENVFNLHLQNCAWREMCSLLPHFVAYIPIEGRATSFMDNLQSIAAIDTETNDLFKEVGQNFLKKSVATREEMDRAKQVEKLRSDWRMRISGI